MHAHCSNKLCLTKLDKFNPPENRIRYAGDFDPTLADLIRGINGAIGFPTSQSELWCIHADLT